MSISIAPVAPVFFHASDTQATNAGRDGSSMNRKEMVSRTMPCERGTATITIRSYRRLSNRIANLKAMRANDEFYLMGRVPKAKT